MNLEDDHNIYNYAIIIIGLLFNLGVLILVTYIINKLWRRFRDNHGRERNKVVDKNEIVQLRSMELEGVYPQYALCES